MCKFVDHHRVNAFICMLNFHSCSQQRNHFNNKIFRIYGIIFTLSNETHSPIGLHDYPPNSFLLGQTDFMPK